MLVAHKASEDSNVALFQPSRDLPSRIRRRVLSSFMARSWSRVPPRPPGATFFSDDRSTFGADMVDQLAPCDILQLHWVSSFVDYRKFFLRLPRSLPIVWTLHDMNPFTGGCHYSGDCRKFHTSCGACPELLSAVPEDFSAQSWRRKAQAISHRDGCGIQIVTPSRWLREQARNSSLFGNMQSEVIPNGVDTETFQPRQRKAAREKFGIDPAAKVALFVAEWTAEKRKGLDLFIEAVRRMRTGPEFCLVAIGRGLPKELGGVRSVSIDYVRDEMTMSMVYSLADVFVIPSLQDNLPNTSLEALACGVPTVAFSVGGLVDVVRPGKTGALVSPGDVHGLGDAITSLLSTDDERSLMAAECRRVAVEEYTLEVQARRYAALYESVRKSVQIGGT
jgi:glycosyltransferase involved in cell wall biosynthesis